MRRCRTRVASVLADPMRPATATAPRAYRLAAEPAVRLVLATLGLACCAMEVDSAVRLGLLVPEADDAPEPERSVLLVAGTVTDALVPAVRAVRAAHSLQAGTTWLAGAAGDAPSDA